MCLKQSMPKITHLIDLSAQLRLAKLNNARAAKHLLIILAWPVKNSKIGLYWKSADIAVNLWPRKTSSPTNHRIEPSQTSAKISNANNQQSMLVAKYWAASIPVMDLKRRRNACPAWMKSVPRIIKTWTASTAMNIAQFAMSSPCPLRLAFAAAVAISSTSNA